MGFDFVLTLDVGVVANNQTRWRCFGKWGGLFFDGFLQKGRCPKDGAGHAAAGWVFSLSHDYPASAESQIHWRFCDKCAGLFFDGAADKGHCPADGAGHQSAGLDFGLPHNPGQDERGSWRFCTRCHGMVRDNQRGWAQWIAPCVVDNATHPQLPVHAGSGLVMIGFDGTEFRLGWMPLVHGSRPAFDTTHYYHAGIPKWCDTPDVSGPGVFSHSPSGQYRYTHVSAAWLAGPRRWIALYANALDKTGLFDAPIVVRFSEDLVAWSGEIPIFDPNREGAYGVYMHKPGKDKINPNVPPAEPPGLDNPGWAYGAFVLERFTTWDETSRTLGLYYLLSLSSPYQVQLMHSTLRIP